MKEKQNKRWALKLLSVLCAFLVWLGVVNVADPVMTDTVEVPVEVINGEILTANDLTYEIVGKKTATISYEVNTTNAHRIRASDFRAYADMTDLWSVTGSIPINIEMLSHSEFLVSEPVCRTSTIKIETEPLQSKQFSVGAVTVGTQEDGYEVGAITVTPEVITMEGPESLIGQISSVGIEIDVNGISADQEGTASLLFYDANGNKILLSDRITCDYEEVSYTLTLLRVKNLTLDFEVSGEVADGYRFTGVECDVRTVSVVGLKSVLASLNTITIPSESLDISGARSNVVRTINLADYLPAGVSLADEDRDEVTVTLMVERLVERDFQIELNDASYTGRRNEYVYRANPQEITVRIRALEEELDSLELDSSDVSIDVSMMTEEGTYTVEPQLNLELDQVYEFVSISQCTIHVIRLPEATTEDSGTDAETEESGFSPEETLEVDAEAASEETVEETSSHAEEESGSDGTESSHRQTTGESV